MNHSNQPPKGSKLWEESFCGQPQARKIDSKVLEARSADAVAINPERSLEWYKQLCTRLPVIYFALDESGVINFLSRASAEQLGYRSEELVGFPLSTLIHPNDRWNFQRLFVRLLNSEGESDRQRSRLLHRTGETLWVNLTACQTMELNRSVILVVCETPYRTNPNQGTPDLGCSQHQPDTRETTQQNTRRAVLEQRSHSQTTPIFRSDSTIQSVRPTPLKVKGRTIQRVKAEQKHGDRQQTGFVLHRFNQQFNQKLEELVQQRTAQLQKFLDFEALLKRITDSVRDSLNESQILETAIRELALGLKSCSCDAALYDLERGTSTICYEYVCSGVTAAQGSVFHLSHYPEIYTQLLQGRSLQFCWSVNLAELRPSINQFTILSCPLINDQGVVGDIWVYKLKESYFDEIEIRLVQQVANQCAIAIRQARLYKAAQVQVAELEHLHRLKDDFLSTVSHELRSPMANIDMAIQMLEPTLTQAGIFDRAEGRASHYFALLRDECQRETNLINNLLDLSRLEAGAEPFIPTPVHLQIWIPHLLEPFLARIRHHQQTLQLEIPADLPPLLTDLSSLERILTELLHNACKYTPPGEQINLSIQAISDRCIAEETQEKSETKSGSAASMFSPLLPHSSPTSPHPSLLRLQISNSGVEISAKELPHLFDKFYRASSSNAQSPEGTGLGLALVKRFVEHLGGTIRVESAASQVTFTLELPIAQPLE